MVSFIENKTENPFCTINNIGEILQMLLAGVRSENTIWAQNNGAKETIQRLYSIVNKRDVDAFLQFFGLEVIHGDRLGYRLRIADYKDKHAYRVISDPEAYPIFEDILTKSELKCVYDTLTSFTFCRRCSEILSILEGVAKDLGCLEEYKKLLEEQ